MNSKNIGDISEAKVIAAFLNSGKSVSIPFGDNQRYDLLIDDNGKFLRVQVKTARETTDGILAFNVCSMSTKNGKMIHVPYHGQIDVFAVYWREQDKIFLVPVEKTGGRAFTLRYKPLSGRTRKYDCNYASEYEMK